MEYRVTQLIINLFQDIHTYTDGNHHWISRSDVSLDAQLNSLNLYERITYRIKEESIVQKGRRYFLLKENIDNEDDYHEGIILLRERNTGEKAYFVMFVR